MPLLNKGTAFTAESEKRWVSRVFAGHQHAGDSGKARLPQYERLPDALSKNVYLTALHDLNEVLFYGLFSEHLREMIPIVHDLTVGMAMEQYHHQISKFKINEIRKLVRVHFTCVCSIN